MKAYEMLYFVDPGLEEEAREALAARIESTITGQDGVIDSVEPWGKRKLAYEINKLQEGDYTLVNFSADPTSIAELDRVLRITDSVVRFIVVRKDSTK